MRSSNLPTVRCGVCGNRNPSRHAFVRLSKKRNDEALGFLNLYKIRVSV